MGTNLLRNTHQELQRKEKGNDNFDKEYYFRNRAASAEEKVRTAWSYSWLGCHVRLLLYFLISTLVYLGWRLLLSLSIARFMPNFIGVRRTGGGKNKRQFTASQSVECRLKERIHSLTRVGEAGRGGATLCPINYRRKKGPPGHRLSTDTDRTVRSQNANSWHGRALKIRCGT